jgi:hypothetical protein
VSYRCGDGSHGEVGCGLFFCEEHRHRWKRGYACCSRCADGRPPYEAKADVEEWVQHKLTDPSWARWRAENPKWVARHKPPNVEFSGVPAGHLSNHSAFGTSAETQG